MGDDGRSGALALVAVRSADLVAFSTLRRQPLLVHATRAVADLVATTAIVTEVDPARVKRVLGSSLLRAVVVLDPTDSADLVALDALQAGADVTLIHDPQCPLVSSRDLQRVINLTAGAPQVGVRPVTDTIKSVVEIGDKLQVSATVDRDAHRVVCAPLALPRSHTAELRSALGASWALRPLAELVGWLREHASVDLVDIAAAGLRVEDEDGLWLLECVDDVRHRVRAR